MKELPKLSEWMHEQLAAKSIAQDAKKRKGEKKDEGTKTFTRKLC